MDLSILLTELSESDAIADIGEATAVAEKYLSEYMEVENRNGSLVGMIKGNGDRTIMLDAHIDEIGMMVTFVDDSGFVKVSAAGGIDRRILQGTKVHIHAKKAVMGVFCSTPPHLRGSKDSSVPSFDELFIDTGITENATEIISVGDRVTFVQSAAGLNGTQMTCKALDNRASVAALIKCADLLSQSTLPCSVMFLLSNGEEIGGVGAQTCTFELDPDEAIALDVTFARSSDCPDSSLGEMGKGGMIGISPILSADVSDKLTTVAKENGIDHQFEVMGSRTGTNADKITLTKSGIKTGLVSIPIKNMHTPVEIVDLKDIESVARLLAAYIIQGGSVSLDA